MLNEGSKWRRWDLHLHSPATALNNQFEGESEDDKWERYLSAIEGAGPYGCLGITDYLSVDGYRRVAREKEAGRLPKVDFILPNVEFRILPVTGKGKGINIHLIIDPVIVDELEDRLFSSLTMEYKGDVMKATRSGLISLGKAFSGSAAYPEEAAHRLGVEQFKFDFAQLRDCLRASERLRRHCLVVVANGSNDGNSGIQDSGLAAIREEVYRIADCIFSGREADRTHFLGLGNLGPEKVAERYGSVKPCIHGCDAHSLDKIGKPDLDRHTWIKADTSFEGLKQICHEPQFRVHIGPFAPAGAVNRLKSLRVELPNDANVHWEGVEIPFCLRGATEIALADGLTCVIGGRGAGKSTLLNIIHESLAPGQNEFFKNVQPRSGRGPLRISDATKLEAVGDIRGLEFISQNAVEEFARDTSRLTASLLARLMGGDDDGSLSAAFQTVERTRSALAKKTELVAAKVEAEREQLRCKAAIAAQEALIASVSDAAYVALASSLKTATEGAEAAQRVRLTLRDAVAELKAVLGNRKPPVGAGDYADRLRELIATVETAVAKAESGVDLSVEADEEIALKAQVSAHKEKIERFLAERGFTPQNVDEAANASVRIASLTREMEAFSEKAREAAEESERLQLHAEAREDFEKVILTRLGQLNVTFANIHKEVKKIAIRYRFDNEAAETFLAETLTQDIERTLSKRVRWDHAAQELRSAGDLFAAPLTDVLKVVREGKSKTAEVLDVYFGMPGTLARWDFTRQAVRTDVQAFMRLDILYDQTPLERASFGQRCSAVLIVLLSLGNNPIVIDEPEAHLDSALIANFLVDLIKHVKSNRQVIFATHNANFVVNGDADLIHIVEMDAALRSTIRPATIEYEPARPFLLALEGGAEAFRKREWRYGLSV